MNPDNSYDSQWLRNQQFTLFEQTAEALASAIDAKDSYTNGHSRRVADYSRRIAIELGKSEEECQSVYFAALLHDVGKIGVPVRIITKKGRLTDEEYRQIKLHPVIGSQILSSIQLLPYLSIAARYHHERYDGRGYPEGLRGEEIPEIARIVAVADAYDAMSSNRSYRSSIPQHIVREELVKGSGTQFDPVFAKAMLQLLDHDVEYCMREMESDSGLLPASGLHCESIYHDCTQGIRITESPVTLYIHSRADEGFPEGIPTLIVFDALDGRVHPGEENNKDLMYFEYARVCLDGQIEQYNTRNAERRYSDWMLSSHLTERYPSGLGKPYYIEAVRYKDHARIRISDGMWARDIILALPDNSRFMYIAITGDHCTINSLQVEIDESEESQAGPGDIPRIAEEINYIDGEPVGDVPNVQVDGWRLAASRGIPVENGLTLTFHTMSLPTARLVWHCPFISVYSSKDGQVGGEDFREYILLRLDGENWESDEYAENRIHADRKEDFEGWNTWKEKNRQGFTCSVRITREGNQISMHTENLGIAVSSLTILRDNVEDVYVALTGDQCAITDIHVTRQIQD